MTRALLAWAPVRGTFWSGVSGGCVTRWLLDKNPVSTLSVRTRLILEDGAWLPGHSSDMPPDSMARVFTMDDGIPIKEQADVLVKDAALPGRRDLSFRIGDTRIGDTHQRSDRLHAFQARTVLSDRASIRLDRDLETFQLAPPEWRAPPIGGGSTLGWDIDGIAGPSGNLDFTVAALAQFEDGEDFLIEMTCDSIRFDLQRGEAALVWRGIFVDETWGETTERIVIGVFPCGLPEETQRALLEQGLPRAVFTLAGNAEDIEAGRAAPPLRDEELAMARLTALGGGPGAPLLNDDEFEHISSELARGRRSEVLAKYGFDEIAWGTEEWAQGERAAGESAELSGDFADEDRSADIENKLTMRSPRQGSERPPLRIEEYARLSAHLEVRDPGRVLAEAKLSVRDLIELEEAINDAIERDPAVAAELSRLRTTFNAEVERARAEDLALLGLSPEEDLTPS
ncbi:MAG: hypothetical protein HUU21_10175 [Polyangiaceae bacterium]|nr:hypothetical protein [Polyangiaceae bacterium]